MKFTSYIAFTTSIIGICNGQLAGIIFTLEGICDNAGANTVSRGPAI